ncbi:POZ domain-containing protein [Tothia fuscella]|uniref:POZ domain-containing protein n=1 Tax=Tothia fuscella TaxID=1048955 RepID=A0A9P4NYH1_9PEZI|nr:POZ domain-containing protein [Tothia fuscella]
MDLAYSGCPSPSDLSIPLAKGLSERFGNGQYSDLTIKCGDKNFQGHKVVVCSQSEFFNNACKGGFKESDTNIIDCSNDDQKLLGTLLRFLYTLKYAVPDVLDGLIPLEYHVKLHALADFYQVVPLQTLSMARFFGEENCPHEQPGVLNSIKAIYESTTAENVFRTTVMELASRNLFYLLKDSDRNVQFSKLLLAVPEFARDMVMNLGPISLKDGAMANVRLNSDSDGFLYYQCSCIPNSPFWRFDASSFRKWQEISLNDLGFWFEAPYCPLCEDEKMVPGCCVQDERQWYEYSCANNGCKQTGECSQKFLGTDGKAVFVCPFCADDQFSRDARLRT